MTSGHNVVSENLSARSGADIPPSLHQQNIIFKLFFVYHIDFETCYFEELSFGLSACSRLLDCVIRLVLILITSLKMGLLVLRAFYAIESISEILQIFVSFIIFGVPAIMYQRNLYLMFYYLKAELWRNATRIQSSRRRKITFKRRLRKSQAPDRVKIECWGDAWDYEITEHDRLSARV